MGSDRTLMRAPSSVLEFQPALPVWGATLVEQQVALVVGISTRAPRVGSDLRLARGAAVGAISTRAPRVGSDRYIL